jgi:multicomponent K+:H+ antiporter subunit G
MIAVLPEWADALVALLLIAGAVFALLGSIGLARFHDFYKRLHGPTKATTLGVGGVLLASALYFSLARPGLSVHEFLITVFLFLTAPISAHLLVKAALSRPTEGSLDDTQGRRDGLTEGERGSGAID